MTTRGIRRNGPDPPIGEALSRIEAALQAGLGENGRARPDLARKALAPGAEPDALLEAWLESVAAELQSTGAAVIPPDTVEAVAERILSNRKQSLGAYGRIDGSIIEPLVRPR